MATQLLVATAQKRKRRATKDPFSLGASLVNLILYMASPNGLGDREGRMRWSQTMLLVAGKKMAGWSEVKKETGLVPAAEVVPHAWAHRFLPQQAKEVSGGADERDKVPLPWLNLVATGSAEFKWSRCADEVTITEDGKRAVLSSPLGDLMRCVVAEPQATQGRHWFEVQILNPGDDDSALIGWSAPGVPLDETFDDKNKGCAWCVIPVQHIYMSDYYYGCPQDLRYWRSLGQFNR